MKQATGFGHSLVRTGLTLGMLSAIGPLAIDLYLPAFPTMVRELATTPGEVQRTLSAFFLALGLAQIPIGSFGDRFGRKLPLYIGLSLFVLTSLACIAAPGIHSLIALRFVQGFGVCAGTAVSRAMIRDLHQGHEAARLMALSFLVIGVSPILAPPIGSVLLTVMSWRGLFAILAGLGVLGLLLTLALPESLPKARRLPRRQPVLPAYVALLRHPRFVAAAAIAGLATTIPYAYLTAAPFVFNGLFGLTPKIYSLLLGANAVCSIGTTQLSPVLMRRWGARRLILRVAGFGIGLSLVAGLAAMAGFGGLVLFQVYSMILFSLVGLLLTPAAITALDAGSSGAGAAAGALGTLQLIITAAASGLISLFPSASLAPLLLTVLGCVAISFALCLWTIRPAAPELGAPAPGRT